MRALLAVDPFADAEDVVARALPWLDRFDARADLLFVDANLETLQNYGFPPDQIAAVSQTGRQRMDALAARIPEARRGGASVELGAVEERVAAHAADHDTIVVGTRSRTGLARLWLGSTAERIVRTCPAPVLVVKRPPAAPTGPLRVVVAVDPRDELARHVVEATARWLGRRPALVDLLYVHEPALPVVAVADPSVAALLAQSDLTQRAEAADRMRHWMDVAFEAGARGEVRVDIGPAVTAITAAGDAADLLVLGTHGRRGVGRLFGSVAERAVRLAACSVLVIHPR